jgi:hypothetical protein
VYEEKGIEMSKHSSAFNTIPSVLSIPEKLNAWIRKLLGLRFPVERHFSGRDLLLAVGAGLLLLLGTLIRALAPFRRRAFADSQKDTRTFRPPKDSRLPRKSVYWKSYPA